MTGSRPGNRKRPSAYAPTVPINSDSSVTETATIAEFSSASGTGCR